MVETNEYGELTGDPDDPEEFDRSAEEIIEEAQENTDEEELEVLESFTSPDSVDTIEFDSRIDQYQAAAEFLGVEPELVYEPANGNDTSTAAAFPEAQVLFADIDQLSVEAVNREGYNAVLADAEELALSETPDLTVLQNSLFNEKEALQLNPSEYVLANDYTGAASNVMETGDYRFVGRVPQNQDYVETGSEDTSVDDIYIFQRK